MSIATHAIKYGWVYLASLTIGTGTIFMVNPVLNRITLHDRIEVFLGVVERCYATQTGTNTDGSGIYAVAPPVEVRTWYDANGTSVTVTNAIEWRDDLSMKVDLDAKIFALIPCYVDPATVYDGTTNISMLTVTGLFASLQIGDHTNQFTAVPAIGTNAATYGPWAWRNYVVAWQERYKVLNALRCVKLSAAFDIEKDIRQAQSFFYDGGPARSWENYQLFLNGALSIVPINTDIVYLKNYVQVTDLDNAQGWVWQNRPGESGKSHIGTDTRQGYVGNAITMRLKVTGPKMGNTNLATIKSFCQQYILESPLTEFIYYDGGPIGTNILHSYYSSDEIYTNLNQRTVKEWAGEHEFLIDFPAVVYQSPAYSRELYGADYSFNNPEAYLFPQFNYCTEQFW
jgi:hypothetical protein